MAVLEMIIKEHSGPHLSSQLKETETGRVVV
jgi:hypothetical protein